jgi:NhaP-type Na+/H+ or K+/H+ antiporter
MNPGVQVIIVAIVGGVLAQWVSALLRVPAIVPLLALGIGVGPQGLGLMPRPGEALPGGLPALVAIGVAIILFEGGLTLNFHDLKLAPRAVRNLLSIGAVVSFIGATICARYIAGQSWDVSLLYGSIMIVTGPTVIGPLLKLVPLTQRAHSVLLWESILIDPIGAIAAVLCLDLLVQEVGVFHAAPQLVAKLLVGPIIGLSVGWLLSRWLKRRQLARRVNPQLDHLLALAMAIFAYGVSEWLVPESGLGAVVAAGFVLGNTMSRGFEELRQFKETITTLLVSILFMVLAADFDLRDVAPLWPEGFLAIAALMAIVRPLQVMLCTRQTRLTWQERTFISCMSPRGIVAASVASLFALILHEHGDSQNARSLVALTFSTIMVTVAFSGLAAPPLAWLLGVRAQKPAVDELVVP